MNGCLHLGEEDIIGRNDGYFTKPNYDFAKYIPPSTTLMKVFV